MYKIYYFCIYFFINIAKNIVLCSLYFKDYIKDYITFKCLYFYEVCTLNVKLYQE